jgi:starch synthase
VTAILVSHPHAAAVSAGLAARLADRGKLAGYFTGLAFAEESWAGQAADRVALRYATLRNRIIAGVPPERLRSLAAVEIGSRLAAGLLHGLSSRFAPYNAIFVSHDRAVSWAPWPAETSAVYAYEDGALRTFERAARRGIDRIWDLPTPHYETTEAIFRGEAARWPDAPLGPPHREPDWKRHRKDAELALASQISVASNFTLRSLDAIDRHAPVAVIPYGFPVDDFAPRPRPPSGGFRALSVGAHDIRKGTPYLLEAWKRAAIPDSELLLVGPLRLAKTFLDRYAGLFRHLPHVPRNALAASYAAADLLVFPTLGDGFGLVIQEAMCCGTPVLTTPCGGGPECITDGVDGWIAPPRDLDALVERLRYCASNRDRVFAMGRVARARAERWTWRDAGEALIKRLDL